MVTARKTFEENGYRLEQADNDSVMYATGYGRYVEYITFDNLSKEVFIGVTNCKPGVIRAIYKQCSEMGWYK